MSTPNFWKRTLEIFRSAPVRIQLQHGAFLIGDILTVGEHSCTLRTADGKTRLLDFSDLRGCEPAIGKL